MCIRDSDYIVYVKATDVAGLSSKQGITVSVLDVDEINPIISGPSGDPGDSNTSIDSSENASQIFTFSADETVTWSINEGSDAALFNIDENSGILSFKETPSFADPIDSNKNNDDDTNIEIPEMTFKPSLFNDDV